MKINRKLNFVIPIYEGDKISAYVHSTPIGRDIFDRYFMTLAKTFSAIYGEGLGAIAGPRVAKLLLEKVAKETGDWEGDDGVQKGLLGEINRLSNAIVPSGKGWETIPLETAFARGTINEDDAAEVENALAFFTVASAMHKQDQLAPILNGAARLWGAQTSSLNCTEFANSLPTSNAEENTGATVTALSIPH